MSDNAETEFAAAADENTEPLHKSVINFMKKHKLYTAGGIPIAITAAFAPIGAIAFCAYAGLAILPPAIKKLRKNQRKDWDDLGFRLTVVGLPIAVICAQYQYNQDSASRDAKSEISDEITRGHPTASYHKEYTNHSFWVWHTTQETMGLQGRRSGLTADNFYQYFTITYSNGDIEKFRQEIPPPAEYANEPVFEGTIKNAHDGYFTVTEPGNNIHYYHQTIPQPPKGYDDSVTHIKADGSNDPN